MPTPIIVRLGLWNLFGNGDLSSSPAQPGAVYSGDRNGKPRCTLVESVAPMVQALYHGESGENVNIDAACLFDHNQLAANSSVYVRFMVDYNNIFDLTRVPPGAIAARTNLTAGSGGLTGFQQDPADPRAGVVFSGDSPTANDADTEVRLDFAVDERTSLPLSGDQSVSVRWHAFGELLPTVRLDLYDPGGGFIRTIYDVEMTDVEQVISGTFPATDLAGRSAFQLRLLSDSSHSSVAAAQAAMVVFDRSGWQGDSGWLALPQVPRAERELLDPRSVLWRLADIDGRLEMISNVYLAVQWKGDLSFPVRFGDAWFCEVEAPLSAGTENPQNWQAGSELGRRPDFSATQTPSGSLVAPADAVWPIETRITYSPVQFGSAVDLFLRRIGGAGPSGRLLLIPDDANLDSVVAGVYGVTVSPKLPIGLQYQAVAVELSLTMAR